MAHVIKSKRGRKASLTDSARKRHRSEVNARTNKHRIYIGSEHDRWMELKTALRLDTHAEVAKVLLDRYEKNQLQADTDQNTPGRKSSTSVNTFLAGNSNRKPTGPTATMSTPAPVDHNVPVQMMHVSDVSGISSSEQEIGNVGESEMSGVEEIKEKHFSRKDESFMNPFDLTITVSEGNYESEDHSSDEDYEPSFDLTFREDHDGIKMAIRESEDEDESEEGPIHETEDEPSPNVKLVRTEEDVKGLMDDNPFLVFQSSIISLAKTNVSSICSVQRCGSAVVIKTEIVSSALYLKWICNNGHHVEKWCSQPVLNRRMHSGDLLFSAALLLSGNNYQKIADMSKFLKLPIPCNSTYLKIQRTYLIPSVDQFWIDQQAETINEFADKDVILMGDGRMDSPGHCAQYCSYTFMEYSTKKILCSVTMDKRMTEKKSTTLEKSCFLKGLRFLLSKDLRVVEIVTDAHTQIESSMRNEFPAIKHSFDIWHGAKNLGKKIIKVAQEKKQNKPLLEWTRDIVNHFWHCADICSTKEEFIGCWYGVVHHVTDVHQWILPYSDSGSNSCQHGPLTTEREKGWLEKGTPAHNALLEVVMNKYLLRKIPYYLNCRSTSELENFQNLILKYASKRHAYGPPTYRARNTLAVLDHNAHSQRLTVTNKDGSQRLQRYYSKKGGRWTVSEVKSKKTYEYIPSLMTQIVKCRLNDDAGMSGKVVLHAEDPRRVSATLAPIPPPPTEDLMAEKKSRYSREDPDKTIDYDWP